MEFRCAVEPHYEDPAFQYIHITALSGEDEEFIPEEDESPQAEPKSNGLPYETVLGSATLFRYFDPEFHADYFPRYAWDVMDGESGDLEVVASLAMKYGRKVKYQNENEEVDFVDRCSGFLVIDRIKVAPFARGHDIGAQILKEIRRQHAGLLMYCALTAEPYDMERGPERDKLQKRLIAWYKKQENMHFKQLAPRKHPQFLMAAWDGRDVGYGYGEIADVPSLVESWKASGEDA